MSSQKAQVDDGEEDSSNETFVVYGTELPYSLDSSEQDKGKFQPIWKQEARDEQGVRRFHGAFKGGWSAGWTPSSFVSSRNNRSERKTFEPKDFMDEEDLEELEQNKRLVTTEEFDSFGSTERELEKKHSMMEGRSVLGTFPDKLIDDLVLPSKEPVGMRLLKVMGWREGQGIGPRIDYHTSLMEDDDMIVMGGKKNTVPKEKKLSTLEKKLGHGGSLPLNGFVLAKLPVTLDKWFSPPVLPQDFTPYHRFDSSDDAKNTDGVSPLVQKAISKKQTTLAVIAEQRGALLGEVPLNAPSRSVFDYVSRSDKERLGNLIGCAIDTTGEKPAEKNFKVNIPKVEKEVALQALKGYIPFEDNKKKQIRYKQFLEAQAEITSIELLKQPEELTSEEYIKELNEFTQAARIFRPISKMMASRFTSSKSSSDEFKQPISESSAETAARMNMFGALTRTRTTFYPTRLLCKRFNVANPHPDHKDDSYTEKTQKGQKEALSKETMDDILLNQDSQSLKKFGSSTDSTNDNENSDTKKFSQAEFETSSQLYDVKEVDVQHKRPAMELFESIFGTSDSEGDNDKAPKHKEPPNMIIGDSNPPNAEKSTSSIQLTTKDDESSTTPFRPMFKKRADRTNDSVSNPHTESINSKSYSKIKGKDQPVKGSLSFEDSFIGPTMDITASSKRDSHTSESSSDESDLNLQNESKRSHSHKHSKKRKTEKKKKHSRDAHSSSKKKSKKRTHKNDSDHDEKHRKTKKKKRENEESSERRKKHSNDDMSLDQEVKLPNRRNLIQTSTQSITNRSHENRQGESSDITSRKRNRPRAMDLW
ncbi:18869_t:CDS:10 [Acaulospora morrowiae]|uniref:18869_t:CDS:1 n=1 Tax=Acaulospora morrowiae TaxID=94023 RepID=A0A9N8V984_9GLOM|nr:18869_t:CDS:10 [Acaulospora morrowiae]